MRVKKWLVLTQRGKARLTAKHPSLARNEIALVLNLDIPNELFMSTHPEVNINVASQKIAIQPTTSAAILTPKGSITVNLR